MAELGWAVDVAAGQWRLLDGHGSVVPGSVVPLSLTGRADWLAQLNAYGARRLWPELAPGSPPWHLLFLGGPMDGLHEFVSQADYPGEPPSRWTLAWACPETDQAGCLTYLAAYVRGPWRPAAGPVLYRPA